jgi:hypothetical protein
MPTSYAFYPHHAGLGTQPLNAGYRILAGKEQLQVASVNLVLDEDKIVEQLINYSASTRSEVKRRDRCTLRLARLC